MLLRSCSLQVAGRQHGESDDIPGSNKSKVESLQVKKSESETDDIPGSEKAKVEWDQFMETPPVSRPEPRGWRCAFDSCNIMKALPIPGFPMQIVFPRGSRWNWTFGISQHKGDLQCRFYIHGTALAILVMFWYASLAPTPKSPEILTFVWEGQQRRPEETIVRSRFTYCGWGWGGNLTRLGGGLGFLYFPTIILCSMGPMKE